MTYWNAPPHGPLTAEQFNEDHKPRHGWWCGCSLCQMDRELIESVRATLFGAKKEGE